MLLLHVYAVIDVAVGDEMACYTCMTGEVAGLPNQYLSPGCGKPFTSTETTSDSELFLYCVVCIIKFIYLFIDT